jgi:AraC-like DNA-binding protein
VEFRQEGGLWAYYRGAVIPSDLPHEYRAVGKIVANIFFEPETPSGRKILERFGTGRIGRIDPDQVDELARPVSAAFEQDASNEELARACSNFVSQLAGEERPRRVTDQRVLRVIDYVMERLHEPITLADGARIAGLSEGRFRHLFVEETGVAFRPYLLWTRLNHALGLASRGESLTEAAHAANFADSAHLTRTCRRMFGVLPSALPAQLPVPTSLTA